MLCNVIDIRFSYWIVCRLIWRWQFLLDLIDFDTMQAEWSYVNSKACCYVLCMCRAKKPTKKWIRHLISINKIKKRSIGIFILMTTCGILIEGDDEESSAFIWSQVVVRLRSFLVVALTYRCVIFRLAHPLGLWVAIPLSIRQIILLWYMQWWSVFCFFFQILMFASSYRTVSICVVLRFHYDFEIFYVVYAENLHPINYISQLRYRTSMLVHCTV